MADVTINGLAAYATPQAGDFIGVWDIALGQYKKVTRTALVGVNITGGGTIDLGGFTLTVPASGTPALLEAQNVFTVTQNIVMASDTYGMNINTSPGAVNSALRIRDDTLAVCHLWIDTAGQRFCVYSTDPDLGTKAGVGLRLGRNANASTPAAGFLRFVEGDGTPYNIWVDVADNLRIGTNYPSFGANDTSGIVVGTQTSSLDAKNIVGVAPDPVEVLGHIAQAAAAVCRFVYKSGAFGGEEFSGLVTDYASRYGMDRDEQHPAGKSLNMITAIGDLMIAVNALAARVAALEPAQRA